MENNVLNKTTVAYVLSFAITTIFNGLLVILKETYTGLKDWMASLTGHHWATHGLFVILLFILLGYLFSKTNVHEKYTAKKLTDIVIWSTVIGTILIIGYFLIHIL
ncbi:hypothetical protein L1765_13185 [Microaerobacter geothermalis]|uniref:hypothetical protein n=1 Tax=Microaerobacter geothermalis TaxID=674972 RepID=UPI001F38CFBB|nr:hypothetical protein [Microaerobacter geothermalis]MCF6094915.1 hypothetical protein [Microaerobacter geothermalis]